MLRINARSDIFSKFSFKHNFNHYNHKYTVVHKKVAANFCH